MLASLLLLLVAGFPRSAEVRGIVRDAASAAPIPGARVAILGMPFLAVTDSAGAYRIPGVTAGLQRLRVAAKGYYAREVEVLLPGVGELQIDVELTAHPSFLPAVRIKGFARGRDDLLDPVLDSTLTLDHTVMTGDWQQREIAGRADLNAVLAAVPGVGALGEPPIAVHGRGGASDQNLLLVDELPVYSGTHFGEVGSAINPDAVGRLDFHVGVSPASYGDRLASAIAIQTYAVEPAGMRFRGLVGAGQVRQMVTATGASGRRMFVAGRRSYGSPLGRGTASDPHNGFMDLIGAAMIPIASDTLRWLAFASGNQLGFDAIADTAGLAGQASTTGGPTEAPPARSNAFEWGGGTVGVSWSHRLSSRLWVRSRAWQATSRVDLAWSSDSTLFRARSRFAEQGIGATAVWRRPRGSARGGMSVMRASTRYAVWNQSVLAAVSPALPSTVLEGTPDNVATFADFEGRVAETMTYEVGLRSAWSDGRWLGLEPRLQLGIRPRPWLSVRASGGRSTQTVQSLRNEESVLSAAIGFELPVANGVVPVADGVQGSLSVGVRPASGVSIEAAGYVGRQRGIILVAPVSTQPFATDRFQPGTGRVHGLAARLAIERGRCNLSIGFVSDGIVRATDSARYAPRFAAGRSGLVIVRYRWRPATQLQGEFRSGIGSPSSVTQRGFDWEAGSSAQPGELSGDAVNVGGRVNPLRLPAYAKLDLGVRHVWHFGRGDAPRSVSAAVAVRNVLNGRQALGYVGSATGPRLLLAARRAIVASLAWQF
ncbi:MAG: carboxypeptidase regulatory-like domain-containing protein [Gemmatimonadaceae bacterium]